VESILKDYESVFRQKHADKSKQALTAKRDLLNDDILRTSLYLEELKTEQRVVVELLNKGEQHGFKN
jgi:hypothetical protein